MNDDTDNGILARVPGQYIAEALAQLPPINIAGDQIHETVIEAGHVGKVRIFARKQLARHGKHSHWYWSAFRAAAVE